jgi:putative phosphoesterase
LESPSESRIAVISDVHSNLEALRAVLPLVEGMEVYCLGDVVGYGANPNEVVEALRGRRVLTVMGNHDYAAATGETGMFNARAAMAAKWTAKELSGPNLSYLLSLPRERRLRLGGADGFLTHGSPDDSLWEYVEPETHSQLFGHYLEKLGVRFLGLGHTHVPFVMDEEKGIVFNPGSVGQPRDGDRRASYAVVRVDGARVKVENFRVEYDYETAGSKIRAAGLPGQLADRLRLGT